MARKNSKHKQYIVIGLGRFGRAIAQTLCQAGEEVLGVDRDMEQVENMKEALTQTIQLDAMDREALEALGIPDFDVAFVTMGSDIRASGTIVLLLKELGARRVIAKAQDEFHGRMLEKLGADQVLFPERDMGRRIAHNLISGNIVDYLELSSDYSMAEIMPRPEWLDKSLAELDLRGRLGINVVAIKNGDVLNAQVRADTALREGDVLLIVTDNGTIEKFR